MPSIVKKLLPIPFRTGLEQKEDARWLSPGHLLTATNAVKQKASTFQKRPGGKLLALTNPAATATLTTGRRLSRFKGALAIFAADQYTDAIWTWDEQAAKPQICDRVPEVYIAPPIPVLSYEASLVEMDELVSGGYRLVIYMVDPTLSGNQSIGYYVTDAANNAVVVPAQIIPAIAAGSYASPKVVLAGTTAVLVYMDSGATTLSATTLDMTAPWSAWASPATLQGSLASVVFDASNVAGDTTKFAVAYGTKPAGGGAGSITVLQYNVSPLGGGVTDTISDAQYTTDGSPALDGITLRADNTNGYVWVAYSYRYNANSQRRVRLEAQQWPLAGVAFKAPFSLESAGNNLIVSLMAIDRVPAIVNHNYSDNHIVAWSPRTQALGSQWIQTALGNKNQGLHANQPRITYGATLASRFAQANAIGYLCGYINSTTQGGYVLFAIDSFGDVDTSNGGNNYPMRYVGSMATRLASAAAGGNGAFATHAVVPHLVANASAPGGNVFETVLSVNRPSAVGVTGPTVYQFDFASTKNFASGEIGENLAFACGAPGAFDGQRAFELSFPYAPELSAPSQSSPGGNIGAGTYSYVAIYEHRDWRGQVHRSGRSVALSVTINAGSSKAAFTIPTSGYTSRQKANSAVGATSMLPVDQYCSVKLYRTTNTGGIYYNVDATEIPSASTTAVLNSTVAATVVLTDNTADASLTANQKLYNDGTLGTGGGAVNSLCAPAFQHLIAHKNRLWGVDGKTIWYSKAFTDGEGSGFNELFQISADDGAGPVVALASLDDKLIIFKASSVFYVTGDGPGDGGGQNDLIPPQKIASTVGCVDWRSVVATTKGVYFDSGAGRYILTRDLQIVAVPSVEDSLGSFGFPTSAVVHPTQSRIVWTSVAVDSGQRSGVWIDYDHVLDSWSTGTSSDGVSNRGAVSAVYADALVSGALTPTYHWLREDGQIYRETSGSGSNSYKDGTIFQVLTIQTPWIRSDAIAGFARWRRLFVTFQSLDPHALTVQVAYDYGSTWYTIGTFTAAQITAMATPLPQIGLMLPRHRAQAVSFQVFDASDTGTVTGQGLQLISLDLEVGVYTNERGVRLPAAQRN